MALPQPLNIFLASPGDLSDARIVVKEVIDSFNQGAPVAPTFNLLGWEQVRSTVLRPQEAINQLIHESHFMIVLFREKWGSNPGSPWNFTSGTEEEFFMGLLDLELPERHMRDIWLGFMASKESAQEIQNLRQQIESSHALLYDSIQDFDGLRSALNSTLRRWGGITSKTPRHNITLLPTSNRDVLGPAADMVIGQALLASGDLKQGAELLERAAENGGPDEKLALSQHLGHQGEFERALRITQCVIDYFISQRLVYSSQASEAYSRKAGLLRRQGKPQEAVYLLQTVLARTTQEDDYSQSVRAILYDELGLIQRELGEPVSAEGSFRAALCLREGLNHPDTAKSEINLARTLVERKAFDQAQEYVTSALQRVGNGGATESLANAELAQSQLSLRLGDSRKAEDAARRCLAVNTQLGSRRGCAFAWNLLTQCLKAQGRREEALAAARNCLALNEAMENEKGIGIAEWQIRDLSEPSS